MLCRLRVLVACVVAGTQMAAVAQRSQEAILDLKIENVRFYWHDNFDVTRWATESRDTTGARARNFATLTGIGDIVAVNERPVRGTMIATLDGPGVSPNPAGGTGVADVPIGSRIAYEFAILHEDGTYVGMIAAVGLNTGSSPPGAPAGSQLLDMAIVGGTGAFLGVRGQVTGRSQAGDPPLRGPKSITEDPVARRDLQGGTLRRIVHIVPHSRPEIVQVMHADFAPVTLQRPAARGQTVIVAVRNLVNRGALSGEPFATNPVTPVTMPVDVRIGNANATVVNKLGWPGETDLFRVDAQVPDGLTPGMLSVDVTAAWIPARPVQIPVR